MLSEDSENARKNLACTMSRTDLVEERNACEIFANTIQKREFARAVEESKIRFRIQSSRESSRIE